MARSRMSSDLRLERILDAAAELLPARELRRFKPFLRHYYAYVAPEVIAEIPPAVAVERARAHRELAQTRPRRRPLVRVYNPPVRPDDGPGAVTVIEVVTGNMPFLVDSVRMEVNRQGCNINLAVHPVFEVERDQGGELKKITVPAGRDRRRESFIHLEIDRVFEPERLEALERGVALVLQDVRRAVNDWSKMRARLHEVAEELESAQAPVAAAELAEACRFLRWLDERNFTFLGYRRVEVKGGRQKRRFVPVPRSALGIWGGGADDGQPDQPERLVPVRRGRGREPVLVITKSTRRSTVHRPAYLDYIVVRHFDDNGAICAESRFTGLYTSMAYRRHPREVPLIRNKIATVVDKAGYDPKSHRGKAFLHILETFPRDELFQIGEKQLYETARSILYLADRQRLKLFVREDALLRFVSCLVYVPRDRYDTNLRLRMSELIRREFRARDLDFNVKLTDESLARVEYFVPTDPEDFPAYDAGALEAALEQASRTWADALRQVMVRHFPEEHCAALFTRYEQAFPVAYREDFDVGRAVSDIELLEQLDKRRALRVNLYQSEDAASGHGGLRLKLYTHGEPVAPSDSLPILENMGVKVLQEKPYRVRLPDGASLWIHDHGLECRAECRSVMPFKDDFEGIFEAAWYGRIENDGFNALGLLAGLSAREISLLRAYCKYLLQGGLTYSQAYMEQCLNRHYKVAGDLVELFALRFDPQARNASVRRLERRIRQALDAVASLDEDRILRNFLGVMLATVRTNYYRHGEDGGPKDYISLKFESARVPELPEPRPLYEIFVYSPRTEGVHLRLGKVARGGLRWSDRREDFRTEVLGLVKAQKVKNAIIVPTGAKGGFVVKRPPAGGDRDALRREAVECYTQFVGGMLDITDNIVGGRTETPDGVVRYDGDDSYLVVAADKGTAAFSDIANRVAADYRFWLGDAFASGGSNGYDHKQMGITARGAWEAVKLHFRDMGRDIQREPFTVVGIGDMSGDVFGNGMLLSRQIRLIGAFNHLHIFLDPDPDPAESYRERRRLFRMARSTWDDYNRDLISRGGGIYSRSDKSIALSAPARKRLKTDKKKVTPNELIRLLLQAPVDLLWNGGIGTYVRGDDERDADVGDRATDAVRVTAGQLRCRVIGEGGNLGLTQRARIEYDLNGGRVDTDFIHNAGGVACSDYEVNIKILLNQVRDTGRLTGARRERLLEQMTGEVADKVLEANYWQTRAITLIEADARRLLDEHVRFIQELEAGGQLNRRLEGLPDDEQLVERKAAGKGLTRPEIAVLLSYAKIVAEDELADSPLWDQDPYFAEELLRYFPDPLRRRFAELIPGHPLRRALLATFVVNRMLNRMGCTYLYRMREETGAGVADITRAYTIVWEVFGLRGTWSQIAALDNRVPAATQVHMMLEVARLVYRAGKWLIHNRKRALSVHEAVADYRDGAELLLERVPAMIGASTDRHIRGAREAYIRQGVDEELTLKIVGIDALYCTFDVVDIARSLSLPAETVMETYFRLSAYLDIYWLRIRMRDFEAANHWQDLARKSHLDELYRLLALLTTAVLRSGEPDEAPEQRIRTWHERNREAVDRCLRIPQELKAVKQVELAMFEVSLRELKNLHQASSAGD